MPITIESVKRAIPTESVLVEWMRYQPFDPKAMGLEARSGSTRYVAYVLRRNGDPIAVDIGEASSIDSLVREFRNALSDPKRSDVKARPKRCPIGLKPLRAYIAGVDHLLMSPDG